MTSRWFGMLCWSLMLCTAGYRIQAQTESASANLAVTSRYPAPDATSVCPDTPLSITFSSTPALGTSGKIQIFDASNNTLVETIDLSNTPSSPLPPPSTRPSPTHMSPLRAGPTRKKTIGGLANYNYYPVIVTGNKVDIFPAPGVLAYSKSYYVMIDSGVIKTNDANYPGMSGTTTWKFSTKAAGPAAGATRLTVAADGSGDFATVQAALDFIPDGNTTPTTLFIQKGTYTELIYVANKHAITLLGEDRKQCMIEYATNDRFNSSAGGGGYRRGVLRAVRCNDLVLANLTIRNTTPQGGTQAETIIFNGTPTARAIVTNVDLYSFQDTLQINGQAYVSDCYIEGDVDFMWGSGPCFFENCVARTVRSNAYYTQIRNSAANHGYVYYRCTFDGAPGITGNVLSRIAPATYPNSEVVLIDCVLGPSVSPVAWRLDAAARGGAPPATANLHFWEFNSHDAGGKPIDVSHRLDVSKQLKQPDDSAVIANYSDPTYALGNGWNPKLAPIFKTLPAAGK